MADTFHALGDLKLKLIDLGDGTFASGVTLCGTEGASPEAVEGGVAHDAPDTGNPLKIGAVAIAYGTVPTPVTTGDRTNLFADRAGIPFVISGHPDAQTLRANYTAAQTDTALVTVASGFKIIVTRIKIAAAKSNSVNVSVIIGFGTATTPTGAGAIDGHPGIDPGGGFTTGNGGGIVGAGLADEDLRITSSVPTGGSIDCYITYYTIAV